jgi:hypothetical protein
MVIQADGEHAGELDNPNTRIRNRELRKWVNICAQMRDRPDILAGTD